MPRDPHPLSARFWNLVFIKKRTEPPGKKTGSTEEDIVEENHTEFITVHN